MISLIVYLMSGHYRKPGNSSTMGKITSYPVAPPSTVVGFIESLCGMESGTFRGSFGYGWVKRPAARGFLLRKDHAWSSAGDPGKDNLFPTNSEVLRPVSREMFYDFALRVIVRGPFVKRIQEALRGSVKRYGVLCLGESDNAVSWLQEGQEAAEWVVPGSRMLLPVKAGRGYQTIRPVYGSFDYAEAQAEPPETAWLAPPA